MFILLQFCNCSVLQVQNNCGGVVWIMHLSDKLIPSNNYRYSQTLLFHCNVITFTFYLPVDPTYSVIFLCNFPFLSAHDNDVKEANKTKSTPPHRPSSLQSQPQTSHLSPVSAIQRPASSTSSTSTTPQLLFQPDGFPHLSQHSPSLPQLQALADSQALGPVVNMSQDFLQTHRMGLLTGAPCMTAGSVFPSYPSLTSGFQPGARALPLQGPISVQMALAGEPRHCLSMAYSGGYLGAHHTFTAGCFDR